MRDCQILAICFSNWEVGLICTLGDIYGKSGLLSSQDLCTNCDTPRTSFFFYLQLRSTLKASCISAQGPLTSPPLQKTFHSSGGTSGFVSRFYWCSSPYICIPDFTVCTLALDRLRRSDIPNWSFAFDWDKV